MPATGIGGARGPGSQPGQSWRESGALSCLPDPGTAPTWPGNCLPLRLESRRYNLEYRGDPGFRPTPKGNQYPGRTLGLTEHPKRRPQAPGSGDRACFVLSSRMATAPTHEAGCYHQAATPPWGVPSSKLIKPQLLSPNEGCAFPSRGRFAGTELICRRGKGTLPSPLGSFTRTLYLDSPSCFILPAKHK